MVTQVPRTTWLMPPCEMEFEWLESGRRNGSDGLMKCRGLVGKLSYSSKYLMLRKLMRWGFSLVDVLNRLYSHATVDISDCAGVPVRLRQPAFDSIRPSHPSSLVNVRAAAASPPIMTW